MVLAVNFSGKTYRATFYGVNKESGTIDNQNIAEIARREKPKMIICGASAYRRDWDYKRIRAVADELGAGHGQCIAHEETAAKTRGCALVALEETAAHHRHAADVGVAVTVKTPLATVVV